MMSTAKMILIVDDEFSIVETLAEILTFTGYATVTASNGRTALEAARKQRPALILLDYMMPVMDGLQTLAGLRADADLRDIPVVMMTAAPMGIPRGRASWNTLLIKPFEADRLLDTIRTLIGDP
jgi:CheY-like chemotaxis protein